MDSWLADLLADHSPVGCWPQQAGFSFQSVFLSRALSIFSILFLTQPNKKKRKLVNLLRARRVGVGRLHPAKGQRQG